MLREDAALTSGSSGAMLCGSIVVRPQGTLRRLLRPERRAAGKGGIAGAFVSKEIFCPRCGTAVHAYRNPAPTVDMIIHDPQRGVVLVRRGAPPYGYALPGGFVEEGETVEQAAVREAQEETGLNIVLQGVLGVYSDPRRDPRRHTMSTVFTAQARNPEEVQGGDDAAEARFYPLDALPPLVFDHALILAHFKEVLVGKRGLAAVQAAM